MIVVKNGIDNYIRLDNIQYSYFAGNNYLGLANHPAIVEHAIEALKKYGVNFSASRQTTGTSDIHLELEELLSEFMGQEDAVVFATGYISNMLLMTGLKDQYAVIIADESAHPSIKDGIPNGVPFYFYRHCETGDLADLLDKYKDQRALVITDGIFPLTGEIAPLDRIYSLVEKYDALLLVDDAHSVGVLGENGRGTAEYFNIHGAGNLFQTGTMSKAFGSYGGFIAGDKRLIDQIRSRSTFYGASTALPPSAVAAGCASIRFLNDHPERRKALIQNAEIVRKGISELGYETSHDPTPIIPILFNTKIDAKNLSTYLRENGIIAPAVDYPTTLEKYIVRVTVSSNHTKEQVENLLNMLKTWKP
jgi:7-keto-8-aminopelargonate synthetase-like enzyme